MSTIWLEQRYVFPVEAPDFKTAEEIAFRKRGQIARECAPVQTITHKNTRFWEREGWENCEPYR